MWHNAGIVNKEWLRLVLGDEFNDAIGVEILNKGSFAIGNNPGSLVFPLDGGALQGFLGILWQGNLFPVLPDRGCVIIPTIHMPKEAQPVVPSIAGNVFRGICSARTEFAKGGSLVTRLSGYFTQHGSFGWPGFDGGRSMICSPGGIARVLAGHQRTTRGSANGIACVGVGKEHSLLPKTIDIRGLDDSLTGGIHFVTGNLADAPVIGIDVNDIRLFGRVDVIPSRQSS